MVALIHLISNLFYFYTIFPLNHLFAGTLYQQSITVLEFCMEFCNFFFVGIYLSHKIGISVDRQPQHICLFQKQFVVGNTTNRKANMKETKVRWNDINCKHWEVSLDGSMVKRCNSIHKCFFFLEIVHNSHDFIAYVRRWSPA